MANANKNALAVFFWTKRFFRKFEKKEILLKKRAKKAKISF